MGDLFRINADWVSAGTFVTACAFMLLSVLATKLRGTNAPIDANSLAQDFFRGISAFPLALFAASPLFPALGEAARNGNEVLLSAGAATGLITVLADWWRNT